MLAYLATCYAYRSKSKEIGLNKPDNSRKDKEVREKRFHIVNKVAGELMQRGFVVLSPISHSHPIACDCETIPHDDHEFWLKQDLPWLYLCNILFVLCLPGIEASTGVKMEVVEARKQNKPVVFIDENLKFINEPEWQI